MMRKAVLGIAILIIIALMVGFLTATSAMALFPSYATPQCWGKSAADARDRALQNTANFWKQYGISWKITAEAKDHEPWKPGVYDHWHVITSEPE